ncbi:MAG: PAS domain S-box protein [Deltaproteobacteria bacterium]|nr:PAS domain S-box protein [Deltaproteobacteria bacterium]MBW1993740.1 PAS domain S-box protein [Deltaproteobacteria bacterium]MBW2152916.1 PAS domain S-box protein [Deltaproteobacteria bacterium]
MGMSILKDYRKSLVSKLIFSIGLVLLFSVLIWVGVTIYLQNAVISKTLPRPYTGIIFTLAAANFLIALSLIVRFVSAFVKKPIYRLIENIQKPSEAIDTDPEEMYKSNNNEIERLAAVIYRMRRELTQKQAALNKQRDEYQSLFELVPCLITIQDRDYKLLKYNREFFEQFAPNPGDHCYQAYKGRDQKCEDCPVEKTFEDGMSHYSEETGINKDGTITHWILKTSPIRDDSGEIVAAMEISLDITHKKQLEEKLAESEKKYTVIFNNIPNPVFVLDPETFQILDCNQRVKSVYGYSREEIENMSFLNFFREQERDAYAEQLKTASEINQVAQIGKDNKHIVMNMSIAMSEYMGRTALLVVANDITQRLEAEQQLIQASKMATLGEMATGVAHELNQPLSVIKTGSSFCMKKFKQNEEIDIATIYNIMLKIDTNADRATKIIQHMRQLARKSDLTLEPIQLNDVLRSASDIFNQQLKLRNIEVLWDIQQDLPIIWGDWGRLEQVVINLVLNARDAIEEKWDGKEPANAQRKITIRTREEKDRVVLEVCDTGTGVPEGLVDKIFEPFFTTKEVGKGTGLGLSISYRFVKDCNGDIKVRPNPDGGACFILTFPKAGKHGEKITSARR